MYKILNLIILLAILVDLSGCYTLRKKFIRKKKKEEPIVYVNFKEYPQVPTKEVYLDYYLFVQGWLEELYDALTITYNRKKQKQAIEEAIANTQQMIFFFNEEGKKQASSFYSELLEIKKLINTPTLNPIQKQRLAERVEKLMRLFPRIFCWSKASMWLSIPQNDLGATND